MKINIVIAENRSEYQGFRGLYDDCDPNMDIVNREIKL